MTEKEITRYTLLTKVKQKEINQMEASDLLGISDRHFRRLWKNYQKEGVSALISKRRGKPSNNRLPEEIKQEVLALIRGRYIGFGPSLIAEKLLEEQNIKISNETIRIWMIKEGLWKGKKKKGLKLHPQRMRREYLGELIQIDGSPHDWFEGRREKCCLLGFIDDATSRIMHLKFVEAESTEAYFYAFDEYLKKHGRPRIFYCDRYSAFKINKENSCTKTVGLTQIGRALKELEIELVCANSPQAKGRIERLFKTLQDRLVKELTLRKISNIDDANKYLSEYIEKHNNKFSVTATNSENKHRALLPNHKLGEILCYKTQRKLTKNLELSYEGRILQIITERPSYAMRGALVEIVESLKGELYISYQSKKLEYKELLVKDKQGRVLNRKNLNGGTIPPRGGMVA